MILQKNSKGFSNSSFSIWNACWFKGLSKMLLHYLHTGTYSYLGTKGSVISDHNEFFDSLKDFFALSLRVQGSTFNKKSLGKKVFFSISYSIYLSIFDLGRKKSIFATDQRSLEKCF